MSFKKKLGYQVVISLTTFSILFCSFGLASHPTATTATSDATLQDCSSLCHNHGSTVFNNVGNRQIEDDKEPMPPIAFWQVLIVSLALLYVFPAISRISHQRTSLYALNQQFRF